MQPLAAKPDLIAQTHDALRQAIMTGDLPPCAPLGQEELADRLGVSRQPISHALVLLKREGLIVDRGRKGQMVAPIDPELLRNLYQVRGALDRLAATLAAAAGKDTSRLTQLVADGRRASEGTNIRAMIDADVAFHTEIYELSGNPEIKSTADSFWPHMVRAMGKVLEDRSRWDGIWDQHAAIADAIAERRSEEAGRLAGGHTDTAGQNTYMRLQQAA